MYPISISSWNEDLTSTSTRESSSLTTREQAVR